MRAVLFLLILVVVIGLAAVATGFVHINETRGAKAPQVSATRNGIAAKGGQAPAFDVETGSVKVGTTSTTVKVPQLQVQTPQNRSTATSSNSM